MSSKNMEFIAGGRAIDDRGGLSFINDFPLSSFKRFYLVENHLQGFVRAWHGHKYESKAVMVLKGAAIVAGVEVDDWESPSPDLKVHRFVLSADKPGALFIPEGYANGFKSLTADTTLMFFSSASLEESASDDIRFESRLWDPWSVEER